MRRVILHPPTLSRATLPPPFRESALGFSLHRFAPVQHFGIAYGSRSCQPQLSFIVSTIYDSVYTNGSSGNGYRTVSGRPKVSERFISARSLVYSRWRQRGAPCAVLPFTVSPLLHILISFRITQT